MFKWTGWQRFFARRDHKATSDWMRDVAQSSERIFKARIKGGPKTGRMYGSHRASAPGEYPANKSGALLGSVGNRYGSHEAAVGSDMFYSHFLRHGTTKMARRSMSDNALKSGIISARRRKRPWMRWKHD